ncbi:MAG: type I glutamate--ammonia ligase [bacterium]
MKGKSILKLKRKLKEAGTKFIDLKYAALTGTMQHITIPFERFEEIIDEGVGADGSSLPGYKAVEKGDMLLFPDLTTLFFDPFFEHKTASFLCSVYLPDTLTPFHRDTRNIAKMVAQYLKNEFNMEPFFQPELEFYIFDNCNFGEGPGYSYFRIASEEQNQLVPSYPIRHKGGYHITPPSDKYFNLRNTIVETLSMCNIKCKYHHHEVGPKGQMEIELLFEPLLKTADNIFIAKYLIKCLCQKYKKYVTFMPKPLFDEPGNGLHLHQYLGSKNKSLFYNAKNKNNLSSLCLTYIAGILHHSRALCAFTNPSTNSYKRLIPGFEAPTYTDFAIGSRKTAFRLPAYLKNKKMMEIEYRIPDATANSYLAIAAILLAGIDGIKNRFRVDKKEKLPTNVYEAINALKKDYNFLLRGNIFTMDLIESWIEVKTKQFEEIHIRPHPFEFNLYFGV